MNDQRPDFVVDAMLGNLAKKLRILGFDSKYFSSIEDNKLIELAKNEKRVILTKDEQLAKGAEKMKILAVLIEDQDEINQINQIATRFGLSNFVIDPNFSRCVNCNGKLEYIEKSTVVNKVPAGVYEIQDQFWVCRDCGKIYWAGTHFNRLQEFLLRLNQRLK